MARYTPPPQRWDTENWPVLELKRACHLQTDTTCRVQSEAALFNAGWKLKSRVSAAKIRIYGGIFRIFMQSEHYS